jgi:hypothetical protein
MPALDWGVFACSIFVILVHRASFEWMLIGVVDGHS